MTEPRDPERHVHVPAQRHEGRPHVVKPDYVDRSGPFGMRIACKCCGRVIIGERLVGDPETVEIESTVHGKVIRQVQKVAVGPLTGWAELTMLMDDGSRHVTPCCVDCRSGPMDPECLQAMYEADVVALLDDAHRSGMPADQVERLQRMLESRRPLGRAEV